MLSTVAALLPLALLIAPYCAAEKGGWIAAFAVTDIAMSLANITIEARILSIVLHPYVAEAANAFFRAECFSNVEYTMAAGQMEGAR